VRPHRNGTSGASCAGDSDGQEHEADGSHQRKQEPLRTALHGSAGRGRRRSRSNSLGARPLDLEATRSSTPRRMLPRWRGDGARPAHRARLGDRNRGSGASHGRNGSRTTRGRSRPCPRPRAHDGRSRTCASARHRASSDSDSLRSGNRRIRTDRFSRGHSGRRRLLRRPGLRLTGRPWRKERKRIDVPVRIRGQTDAEVDVRLRPLDVAARPDRAHDVAFLERRARSRADRSQVDERDRVAVGRANRQAQPFVR
jgi:hypothetical protein